MRLRGRIKVGLCEIHVGFRNHLVACLIEWANLNSGGKSHPSRWESIVVEFKLLKKKSRVKALQKGLKNMNSCNQNDVTSCQ